MTVCTIITPAGEVFTGVTKCSMSQPYLWDYGEDTAYNRARVAQGHECAYCRMLPEYTKTKQAKKTTKETKMGKKTTSEISAIAKAGADKLDQYLEETGRIGVGISFTTILTTVAGLSNILPAEDIVLGVEKAAETMRDFLVDLEGDDKNAEAPERSL